MSSQTALATRTLIPDDTIWKTTGIVDSDFVMQLGALYETTPTSITDGNVGIPRMNSNRQLYVDVGNITGTFSSEYAEDTVHTSGDIGNFMLGVRNDAGTPLAADGDYIPFTTDASGNLRVAASVTISAEYAEDSAHTSGEVGSFILAVRNDAGTSLVDTDGDYSPLQVDSTGALRVAASVTISAEYAEDSVHTSGDVGSFILTVRNDVLSNDLTSGDGDYSPLAVNSQGHLYNRIVGDNGGGTLTEIQVNTSGQLEVSVENMTATLNSEYAEDSVHGSGDTGQFVMAVRNDAGTPLAADGDYIPFTTDSTGALRVASSVTMSAEYSEDTPHTSGDTGNFILTVRNDVLSNDLTNADGDYSPLAVNSQGHLYNRIVGDNGGGTLTEIQVNTSGQLEVSVENMTASLNSEYAEDSAHGSGDTGQFVMAVRDDGYLSLADSNNDYTPFKVDSLGALRVSKSPAVDGETINFTTAAVSGSATTTDFAAVTATGGVLYVHSVIASSSAPGKINVKNNGSTVATTFWSAGGDGKQLDFGDVPIAVASGQVFAVDVANRNQGSAAADYYVTIIATQG